MPSPLLSRLGSSMQATSSRLGYHAYTIFLFTKSDIKTTLIPVGCFALGAAPLSPTNSLSHAVQAIFWLWLHLLHFNLANQVHDPEEDMINKPWRPIPTGRITLAQATVLRYLAPFVCMAVSLLYSRAVFYAALIFAILVPIYHEAKGDSHWLSRNFMNAFGYACFSTGSTLIASPNRAQLDVPGALSIFTITAILATTIQAQDFQDVIGDIKTGRLTLPIAFPNFSRYTPMVSLLLWVPYLTSVWEIGTVGTIAFTVLTIIVGLRYLLLRSTKDDQLSYVWYNVWLAIAFSMPGYWRYYKESAAL
ncbi:Fumagillin beta-trans-bergamotene synthase [Psilocybe cubensis]|uniref:Uncharacterized protein n=3 Tax=Psilocybe cubensis TaxID=181762 RepID=A0A8H7XJL4_PSICU|nr:Fumagillin beta-trans-bergamotene synthase [Psilocybe cubensis]XP_047750816.1 Fumagillin beta-trans-bergamotene synthase [Psilocybe cubensis]KAH9483180.1 Fumagillin beta-trans-bergamotene synthase [Psilocybe cubensis]KAH9483191.1 Fumagillin beta-trans-bergamotene synthase [Psilocybe cubensis]